MPESIIYNVDISKDVTPIMVRDAIIKCFTQAQQEVTESMKVISGLESEEAKKISVDSLIENAFEEAGGDFNNPTKESLIKVIMKLKGFAADAFRNPEIIEKHAGEIMQLINKLD